MCLDSNANYSAYTLDCQSGDKYQHWNMYATGGGWYVLFDAATGKVLDSNWNVGQVGSVYTHDYIAGDTNQVWYYNQNHQLVDAATGYCLDGNDNGDPSNLYAHQCLSNDDYQVWWEISPV